MLNILIFFYKHVGNALLIPTYFFGEVVTVGWVKPLAAYPAKTRTGWNAPEDVIDFQH